MSLSNMLATSIANSYAACGRDDWIGFKFDVTDSCVSDPDAVCAFDFENVAKIADGTYARAPYEYRTTSCIEPMTMGPTMAPTQFPSLTPTAYPTAAP